MDDAPPPSAGLRHTASAMFFAYRGFTADPDRILAARGLGRAHHRVLHFVNLHPGIRVADLLEILGITKQSLARVLRTLVDEGLVEARVGRADRRERRLALAPEGAALEADLNAAQEARMRGAFERAGPEAAAGFLAVLEAMMDPAHVRAYEAARDGRGGPA